jgi:hypothetical protein
MQNQSEVISERDHMSNVAQKGYDPSIGLLQISSSLTVLQRLVRNIIQSVQSSANKELIAELKDFYEAIKELNRNI